jgi:hypothetical protein
MQVFQILLLIHVHVTDVLLGYPDVSCLNLVHYKKLVIVNVVFEDTSYVKYHKDNLNLFNIVFYCCTINAEYHFSN